MVLLIAFIAVARRGSPARQGTLSAAERRQNLALVLKFGHAFTMAGLVVTAVGTLLSLTDIDDSNVPNVLLVWVSPYTIVGGFGMYTSYNILRREFATNIRSE